MSKNPGQLTHLSPNTQLVGDITIDNDVRVAGNIKGKVTTTGHLIIENTGLIEGEVKATSATIAGKLIGNIECSERLVLEAKAEFKGDIRTKQLVIEDGAQFQGNCSMAGTAKSKTEGKLI